jgi:hypothetical protein
MDLPEERTEIIAVLREVNWWTITFRFICMPVAHVAAKIEGHVGEIFPRNRIHCHEFETERERWSRSTTGAGRGEAN